MKHNEQEKEWKRKKENLKRCSLREVKQMLGFTGKGFRAVIAWCKEHDILVFGEGRRKRILLREWNLIQKQQLIEAIKDKYADWKDRLKRKGIEVDRLEKQADQVYIPKSKYAKNFMKDE